MAVDLKKLLAEANAIIETVSVRDALAQMDDPRVLMVDVRETVERQNNGVIPGAIHAPRGFLEFIADPNGPMHNEVFTAGNKLLLFCATGGRSVLAAKTLMDMAFVDVAHIAGGFSAWREAGGPIDLAAQSTRNAG
jgi:rhodanese-related sulfurtransferase